MDGKLDDSTKVIHHMHQMRRDQQVKEGIFHLINQGLKASFVADGIS